MQAGKTTRCEATHAYEAANEEELSFPKGAKMFVVGEESATHWKGVYGGKAGLIPKSHVHDATKPPEDKALAGLRCRAIKTYVTDDLGAIAFKVGDIVFVPKPSAEGDTYEGVSGGVIGAFPKSFVVDTATKSKEELDEMVKAAMEDETEQRMMSKFAEIKLKRDALQQGGGGGADDDEADE